MSDASTRCGPALAGALLDSETLPAGVDGLDVAAVPDQVDPAVVTVRGWQVAVGDPVEVITDPARLDELADRCRWRARVPADDGMPPFLGGAVGYLSDDLSPGWLALGSGHAARPAVAPLPELRFGLYDDAVCIPPEGGPAWLVATGVGGRRDPAARLERLRERVRAARPLPPGPPAGAGPLRLSLPAPAHTAAVHRALGWIADGYLYQLNLTLQASTPWRAGGLALARRLWNASPGAAHAAYLAAGRGVEVASLSPETFLRTDGDEVSVRPIKGTRPRRADPEGDRAQAAALLASAKDRAEHVMIVDLERNDLGRVCRVGSVRVPELAALERHPTVWHLTSTVSGRLRTGVSLAELLRATFPCGSVIGAPKRAAVARAALLEPVRRGVYCGAIGVISRGLVDLSVAIRTAVVHGGVASYGTGGGIVADSDPREEFAEAMDKAAAFLAATGASVR